MSAWVPSTFDSVSFHSIPFSLSVCTTKPEGSVADSFCQWVWKTTECCRDENSANINFPWKHLSGNFIEWNNKLTGQHRSAFSCCPNTSFSLANLILRCLSSLIRDDCRYSPVRAVTLLITRIFSFSEMWSYISVKNTGFMFSGF